MDQAVDPRDASNSDLQPHIRCAPGDVSRYVFIPGDQDRAKKIADRLEDPQQVGAHRSYYVFRGRFRGIEMSVCSTGIGCPSAAIALEELSRCGADTFIRVGSAGSLQRHIDAGDVVVATGALRRDGTSVRYAPPGFPAMAHPAMVAGLRKAAETTGVPPHFGVVLCDDAFYAPVSQPELDRMEKLGVLAVEMETSILFTLGTIRGWRTGAVLAIDGNVLLGRLKDRSRLSAFQAAEERAIDMALLAMYRLALGGDAANPSSMPGHDPR